MKKENVPQDMSSLGKITKEVCYATDSSGKYVTELSSGWDVKINALDVAWKDVEERIAKAKQQVLNGYWHSIRLYRLLEMADKKTFKA